MATYEAEFSTPGSSARIWLVLQVDLVSQSIPNNQSTLNWYLRMEERVNASPFNNNATSSANATVNALVYSSGGLTYNFDGVNETINISSGTTVVTHNSDGTKTIGISAAYSGGNPLGDASFSTSMVLPTIPRASTPTFSLNPVDAGVSTTITTNRADAGFTHTIEYNFEGGGWNTIATGVGASTSWTPPLSLLNSIPNSLSGVASIRTTTFSGATQIGSPTTVSLTVNVPSTVVPDFTTITNSEAVPLVSTEVGAYVQNLSKLALAITGAAGIYGSTISSYKIEVAGQTINSSSGVTPAVVNATGTVAIVGTITDSRGRTRQKTVNVTFLPYAAPTINTYQMRRADASGNVDEEEGDRIRVDLNAAVQSIVNTTQRNSLTYKIYTRQHDVGSFVLQKTVTVAGSGVTFNSFDYIGTYAVEDSWDVRVEVSDKFNTAAVQGTVATAIVLMHWDGPDGIGMGKFREQGFLDVGGDIFMNGEKVLTEGSDIGGVRSVGEYFDWPAADPVPPFALVRNGQAVSRTTYGSLFSLWGTRYGIGNGTTTFNVPNDMVERPAFHATAAGVTKSGAATTTKMPFTNVLLNIGGHYNSTLSRFTAPKAGRYEFTVSISQNSNVGGPIVYFYKNGVALPTSEAAIAYYNYVTATGTRELELAAGDYVEVYLANANGTAIQVGSYGTAFHGRFLGDAYDPQSGIVPCVVATDQGSPAGVTIVNGAGGYSLGEVKEIPFDAVLPANCIEAPGTYSASTYSGLAALNPSWVVGSNLVVPDFSGEERRRESMVRIKPTSVTVSGGTPGSIDADGRVTFSATSFISLNGVFSSKFKNYLVVWNVDSASADYGSYFRFRSGTTDDAANYAGSYQESANGAAFSGSWVTDSVRMGRMSTGGGAGKAYIFGPAVAGQVTRSRGESIDNSGYIGTGGGRFNTAKVHDGITLIGPASMAGTIEVYGIGGSDSALTRKVVVAADAGGEYSPTVQAANTSAIVTNANALAEETYATGSMGSVPANNYIPFGTMTVVGGLTLTNSTTLTVTKAGWYSIDVAQLIAPNGTGYYHCRINDVVTYHAYTAGAFGDLHIHIKRKLNVGDTIRFYYLGNAPSSWGTPHSDVSIMRIRGA